MNRDRFDQLLDAYGADFRRWPEAERAAGEAFAAAHASQVAAALGEARALDAALDATRETAPEAELLAKRILRAAPRSQVQSGFSRRAGWALAACAVFGIVAGYGGGMLAPVADEGDTFAAAFEAPFAGGDEG